jgi:hypothetical protein
MKHHDLFTEQRAVENPVEQLVGRTYLKYRGQNVLRAQLQPFLAEVKM